MDELSYFSVEENIDLAGSKFVSDDPSSFRVHDFERGIRFTFHFDCGTNHIMDDTNLRQSLHYQYRHGEILCGGRYFTSSIQYESPNLRGEMQKRSFPMIYLIPMDLNINGYRGCRRAMRFPASQGSMDVFGSDLVQAVRCFSRRNIDYVEAGVGRPLKPKIIGFNLGFTNDSNEKLSQEERQKRAQDRHEELWKRARDILIAVENEGY